jgi:hypothetical protein
VPLNRKSILDRELNKFVESPSRPGEPAVEIVGNLVSTPGPFSPPAGTDSVVRSVASNVETYEYKSGGVSGTVIKFNPLGDPFDIVGKGQSSKDNFSYAEVADGESKVVPFNQQMVVDGHVRVLGHLSVLGDLVDISGRTKEQFFYTQISPSDVVVVEPGRLLMYKNHLSILGHLRVLGSLAEV